MSKRTLALIIALLTVTAVLFVTALSQKTVQNAPYSPQLQPAVSQVPKPIGHTTLSLTPNPVVASNSSVSINLTIDSGTDKVTGVQAELSFDPNILTLVSITKGALFPQGLEAVKKIDAKNGRVSYAILTPFDGSPVAGSATVATLLFTVNPNASASETAVSFLPKSVVSAQGVAPSVLIKTNNARVILSPKQIPITR